MSMVSLVVTFVEILGEELLLLLLFDELIDELFVEAMDLKAVMQQALISCRDFRRRDWRGLNSPSIGDEACKPLLSS